MEITTSMIFFILFLIVISWVTVSAFRNKILFRMAFRNFLRKKGSSVVVIIGLMIGTAIISSSFTVGDTFNTLLASQVLDDMQGTDEVYGFQIPGTRETFEFPIEIYEDLRNSIIDDNSIDGMEPELRKSISVLNLDKNLVESRVTTAGILFNYTETFGKFMIDGSTINSLPEGNVLLNSDLAAEIEAASGNKLSFSFLNRTGNFTVFGILDSDGRGLSSVDVFMNLNELQDLLGMKGMINRIHISNEGEIISGMKRTEDVKKL
ncbi:MAG: ABC transporter permease, partial [Thermoplasmata archaeon]